MSKLENKFQRDLKTHLQTRFPGIIVQKMESYTQGFPDLLLLYNDKWATLECKRSADAIHQPNQDTWIDMLNRMSFAAFVYPENEEEVLDALQRSFQA